MSVKLPAPVTGLSLWLIDLDGAALEYSILSPAERMRMSRFHFERDALHYGRARTALRRLLGAHVGEQPESIRFRDGPHGKPHLDLDGRCVPFSVSHSQGRAIVAIGDRLPIGVDIEGIRRDDPLALETLARSVMAPRELEAWLALEEQLRRQSFHALWTAKEACLKAVGCGLVVEPRSLDVGWEPQPRDVVVPVTGAHASVRLYPLPVVDGCAAAISVLHGGSVHLAS